MRLVTASDDAGQQALELLRTMYRRHCLGYKLRGEWDRVERLIEQKFGEEALRFTEDDE